MGAAVYLSWKKSLLNHPYDPTRSQKYLQGCIGSKTEEFQRCYFETNTHSYSHCCLSSAYWKLLRKNFSPHSLSLDCSNVSNFGSLFFLSSLSPQNRKAKIAKLFPGKWLWEFLCPAIEVVVAVEKVGKTGLLHFFQKNCVSIEIYEWSVHFPYIHQQRQLEENGKQLFLYFYPIRIIR